MLEVDPPLSYYGRRNFRAVELTRRLPSPLPDDLVPLAYVTPEAVWHERPLAWDRDGGEWAREVKEVVDRYRGGHCVVLADCHC